MVYRIPTPLFFPKGHDWLKPYEEWVESRGSLLSVDPERRDHWVLKTRILVPGEADEANLKRDEKSRWVVKNWGTHWSLGCYIWRLKHVKAPKPRLEKLLNCKVSSMFLLRALRKTKPRPCESSLCGLHVQKGWPKPTHPASPLIVVSYVGNCQ